MSWLVAAALIGQLIQAATIPAVARVFSPAALGAWAVIQSVAMTGVGVAGLRYELALPLVRDDMDARTVAQLQAVCATLIAMVVTALVASGVLLPAGISGVASGLTLAAATFVLVLGGAGFQLVSQTQIREGRFGDLAVVRLLFGPGQTIAQLAAGLIAAGGPLPLVWGAAAGTIASLAIGGRQLRKYLMEGGFSSPARLRAAAVEFRRFPTFIVPYSLVTLARDRGSFLLIAAYADLASIGAVAMAQRLVNIPVGLVAAAVSPVLHRRLAASDDRAALEPEVQRLLVVMAWCGIVGYAGFGAVALEGVPWLLGPEWRSAGEFSVALAAWGLSLSLSAVFDRSFDIVHRQSTALWIEGSSSLLSLAALWIALGSGLGLVGAMLAFAGVQILHHLLWIALAWLAMGFSAAGLRHVGLHCLLGLGLSAALVTVLRGWLP